MRGTLKVQKCKLSGLIMIKPSTNFEDFRGSYIEIYNKDLFNRAKLKIKFKQDSISISRKNVLRGIHGDNKTWKLISCLYGTFYLVVVNNNPNSRQFKQWESFLLSETNRIQILIPPKFGNGHLVLSDKAIFHYKQSTNYGENKQFTLKWNDPNLGIFWPHLGHPILSQRDTCD
jgi:dTDP-4-dehydrorhamnose 3,5-epimerase